MYDKKLVIPGLILFLALVTLPFWASGGDENQTAKPIIKAGLTQCVESKDFMRANHMQLLDQWRDSVVRDQQRTYVSSTGKHFDKSLTNTCLECHSNKSEFCDSCHESVGVEPYCWSCHLDPEERI
ncbi:MAG: hypothetical protein GY786_08920 [Proteobacteria bacterium]|nr:hypothetical protein [Pseudomonadota bacterium]